MEERSVVESLNNLDTLIAEARSTKERAKVASSSGAQSLVHPDP